MWFSSTYSLIYDSSLVHSCYFEVFSKGKQTITSIDKERNYDLRWISVNFEMFGGLFVMITHTTIIRRVLSYSLIKAAISSSNESSPGKEMVPARDTRNFPSKFHTGARDLVAFMKNFQSSDAPGPVTEPSFIKMPGNCFDAAKSRISSSVLNSCPPNSREGNPKMTNFSPYKSPSIRNRAYSRSVTPHWLATLVAYTTLPWNSCIDCI